MQMQMQKMQNTENSETGVSREANVIDWLLTNLCQLPLENDSLP
jgi:hypothetical protein